MLNSNPGSFSLTPEMVYENLVGHIRACSIRFREWERTRAPAHIIERERGYWGGLYAAARVLGAAVGADPRELLCLPPPIPREH